MFNVLKKNEAVYAAKIHVLTAVRNSLSTAPINKTDFFEDNSTINIYAKAIKELEDDRLIHFENGSDKLTITRNGILYLDTKYVNAVHERTMKIRYWITTGIAVLALITAIASIVFQLH